jgi:hypothetical protein
MISDACTADAEISSFVTRTMAIVSPEDVE